MTINLSLSATMALEQLIDETGETQTLMMNNALVAYAYMKKQARQGALKVVRDDGTETDIVFL